MFTFFVYVGTLVPPSSAVSNLAYENPAYEAASESISSPNYLQLNETSTVVHWYNIVYDVKYMLLLNLHIYKMHNFWTHVLLVTKIIYK